MRRALQAELAVLALVLAAQAYLFTRPIHSATNFDEDVYLAAVDALRHGQSLGSDVFAAQFPGFYDLLRAISYVGGIGVVPIRAGLLCVMLAGTIGAWLTGRRFGGAFGGLLAAALLVVAPPLDLFGFQVIADTPALALSALALGLATLGGAPATVAAGAVFGAAVSVKLTAVTALPTLVWLARRRLAAAGIGLVLVVAAVLLGHLPALGDLWTSGVTYHERARSAPAVIPHPHRQIVDQIPRTTPFFALALVAFAAALAAVVFWRTLPAWPLWLWVALSLAFLLLHRPLHYNHLVDFPFTLAVAAGATIGAVAMRVPHREVAAAVLAVVLVGAYVQQLHRVDLATGGEPASNVRAARALARLTPRNALIVDDRPIVSFLARRRVVGPLVDLALLRWQTRSLTDAEVIRDLRAARAVVVSRALRRRPRVLAYVRRHYARRYDAGGVAIWVRRAT
jgi:hypothetical protein